MAASRDETRARILDAALKRIPFEGVTLTMLEAATEDAGFARAESQRFFPKGVRELLDLFSSGNDARMKAAAASLPLDKMKIRERIATLVKLRFDQNFQHREAIRRIIAWYSLPHHFTSGMATLWNTASEIWYLAGDSSADFNYYTKRSLLSGVYSTTALFWLDDASPKQQESWDFLARRIEDVMKIEKAKKHYKDALASWPPFKKAS